MKEIDFQLDTLACPSCGAKIEKAVGTVEGVEKVEVLFNSSKVRVLGDINVSQVAAIIDGIGYPVLEIDGAPIQKTKKKSFFRFKR